MNRGMVETCHVLSHSLCHVVNHSFYLQWIYIVPVVLIMVLFGGGQEGGGRWVSSRAGNGCVVWKDHGSFWILSGTVVGRLSWCRCSAVSIPPFQPSNWLVCSKFLLFPHIFIFRGFYLLCKLCSQLIFRDVSEKTVSKYQSIMKFWI